MTQPIGYFCDNCNLKIEQIEDSFGSQFQELNELEKVYLAYKILGSVIAVLSSEYIIDPVLDKAANDLEGVHASELVGLSQAALDNTCI